MQKMSSELVYPSEKFIEAWNELKPVNAFKLADHLSRKYNPVKSMSKSVTSIMRHGEYVKILRMVQRVRLV